MLAQGIEALAAPRNGLLNDRHHDWIRVSRNGQAGRRAEAGLARGLTPWVGLAGSCSCVLSGAQGWLLGAAGSRAVQAGIWEGLSLDLQACEAHSPVFICCHHGVYFVCLLMIRGREERLMFSAENTQLGSVASGM